MTEKILEIRNLKKYFALKKGLVVKAVDNVSLELNRGETLGLVGESGSGKSTIAYTLVGMYAPTEGEMLFRGERLTPKRTPRRLRNWRIFLPIRTWRNGLRNWKNPTPPRILCSWN